MSRDTVYQPFWVKAASFSHLVFTLTVRAIRAENRNPAMGILMSFSQPLFFGLFFWLMITVLGGRGAPIRADPITFIIVGFFLFIMHIRVVMDMGKALGGGLLEHPHATPFLLICVKAFTIFYKQVMSAIILLALNYTIRGVYLMEDPLPFILAALLCWIGGVVIGTLFILVNMSFSWGGILQTLYIRVCFITSGKMVVASQVPGAMRAVMDWNPLFHLIDQARGAVFLNYEATLTSMLYPTWVYLGLLPVCLIIEHRLKPG